MEPTARTPDWRPSARLDGLPGYGRGRAAQAQVFRHRLGSNEAPDAADIAQLLRAAQAIAPNRYPDLRGETLAGVLAERHGLDAAQVTVAAGSVVLLDHLIRASCDPGDEVVSPWRSYEAYPIVAGLSGARLIGVPLGTGDTVDPAAILAAIGPRCRMVLLCNPNNPTGTYLSTGVVDRLLAALPRDILIVLDEAYVNYAEPAALVWSRPATLLAQYPNLAILRTFSKAWGLAGMRVGYCLGQPAVTDAVRAVAPPFPLSGAAIAVALAALEAPDAVAARVAESARERVRMTDGLRALGLPVAESRANFIWLPVGAAAETLTARLAAASIAVRCFAGEGVRITTGTAADTDAVLAALSA